MEPPYRHLLYTTIITGVGLVALYVLLPYTLPFLLAALLSAVIDKPVDYLERRLPLSRGLIVGLVLAALLAAGTLLFALIIANIAAEIEVFYSALPSYAAFWKAAIDSLLARLDTVSARLPHPLDEILLKSFEDAVQLLAQAASGLLAQLQHVPNFLASLFVAAVTTFFLSRDKRALARASLRYIPTKWHPRLFELKRHIAAGSLGLVKGQFILFCLTATLATAGFSAFGIGYAWLLGLLAAFLDVMPLVGPSGVFLPLILYLGHGGEIGRMLGLTAVWGALLLLRQLLEPHVLGAQLGIHPVTMIFTVYTGVKLFGVNGLWLAPFIVVAVKGVYAVVYPQSR